jgi:hypothetical protein
MKCLVGPCDLAGQVLQPAAVDTAINRFGVESRQQRGEQNKAKKKIGVNEELEICQEEDDDLCFNKEALFFKLRRLYGEKEERSRIVSIIRVVNRDGVFALNTHNSARRIK